MATADMDLAPSLPPSPTLQDDDAVDLAIVVSLVFLAVVAIFLLHILGPLRRWLSHGLLHNIVMGVYALSYPLVGYTIGRMQSSDWYFNDFTVWAVFLLLLLSGTDSLTACHLNDLDSWKSIYVKQLFKGFLLVLIVLKFGRDMEEKKVDADYLWYPLSAILFVIVIKSYVMIASMRMVSKSYLGKNVKVIVEYMQHIDNKMVAFDPVSMEGYRYMVAGEKHCVNRPGHTPWYKKPKDLKVTTVEQIWQCKGNLLIGDRGKVLKDLCLSMSVSKMLNRRFAGFKLSEAEHQKTHDFVFKGLLARDKPHLRAFRVIEEELVFVHDMYYTRYSYLYQKGRYLALCLPVIMMSSLDVKGNDDCYLSNQSNHSIKTASTLSKEDAVKTASTLSKYCIHLLAFAPNLLPDHSSMSEYILDQSIIEVEQLFKEAKNRKIKGKNKKIEGRCEILMQIISTDDDCVRDETRLVAQGVQLARHLIDDIQDSTKRWKVLSDFWAELMLYVSPSDDARAHLEVLARGGEFITHLWALLTHAGVRHRGPTEPKDVV